MIIGDMSKHAILQLQSHPTYKFYLTGSRFFNTSSPLSDWDFFVGNSNPPAELRSFLFSMGFRRDFDSISNYQPSITLIQPQVMLLKLKHIHIQVVPPEHLQEKIAAQQFLFENGIIKDIAMRYPEDQRKTLNHSAWDTAVLVVRKAIMPASDPFFPMDLNKQFQNPVKPVDTIPKPNRKMEW